MLEGAELQSSAGIPCPSRPSLAGTRLAQSAYLSKEGRQALEAVIFPPRLIQANVDLAREGEPTDSLFIVTQGWACRYTTTSNGGRLLPAVLVPGDVGNMDSLLFDRLDFSVRTLSEALIVVLPRERALALAAQHPCIARMFIWLALVENAILGKWALSLGRRSAKERLAHLFCELSVRLGNAEEAESSFELQLTQEHIADALGLTTVHVNRTMQQLRKDKLVVSQGRRMTIPDVVRLRKLGDFDPSYLHVTPPAHIQSA